MSGIRHIDVDGRKIRIEFNWNTTIEFLDRCGITLETFAQLSAGAAITPRHIRQLAWCGAIEGERCDGREFLLTEEEFGALLRPYHIDTVMEIFAEQFTGSVAPAQKKTTSRRPLIFRIFR